MSIDRRTQPDCNDEPEYLHHYTTVDALVRIVKEQELWATDIFYLNDREEFYRGLGFLRNVLQQKQEEIATTETHGRYTWLIEELKRIGPGRSIHIHVCSFSERGDDLSQWRAYSPNGGGAAIAFRPASLRSWAEKKGLVLYRCLYDHDEQSRRIRQIVDDVCEVPLEPVIRDQVAPDDEERVRGEIQLNRLLLRLTCEPAAFKNKTFGAEGEWRVTYVPRLVQADKRAKIDFRCRRGMVIPYYRLQLEANLWKDAVVWVGPSPRSKDAKASIERLLGDHPHSLPASVRESQIPYRYW
ncbi:MAG: DUF2971 domain-containing protein [Sedimentisphaerales bacterium]|nr:DUF2971 domain-containing protein [Sedimentisphaerales bacterium]